MKLSRLAPAKVNLYLHVAAPDHRGYHPLRSLVVFADYGDEVHVDYWRRKGRFTIDGPYAEGLSTGEDNLVLKALRLFEAETGEKITADLRLTKNLPLASGIGGGSADAGALLRLLKAQRPEMKKAQLQAIAAHTGADGVMCLWSQACIAEGYGEKVSPVIVPDLPCVLINPGVECPTPAVFRAYDEVSHYKPLHSRWFGEDILPPEMLVDDNFFGSVGLPDIPLHEVWDYLNTTRNDLEVPAIRLVPVIGEVLASLRAQPETRFARMSGSGATCFALCETLSEAETLAARLRADWPKAWVRACTLK
ncbi:4-(cytidine 5'-diphospho)-2-C-methyl-D-erythritol kinase [Asticcacaulis sp.]|uniref:4-(cytidine 5'-diphospho)-2-C-methyl-D-erythritol kinase n=1 Tax=Asticcacaulis sp. TaxID=1872648 RepID=UPI002623B270|nr:4-(cytidine 5'-diphospho)-2-C-methyl-D-erythritol kinase [Asticcacaulis sp.]